MQRVQIHEQSTLSCVSQPQNRWISQLFKSQVSALSSSSSSLSPKRLPRTVFLRHPLWHMTWIPPDEGHPSFSGMEWISRDSQYSFWICSRTPMPTKHQTHLCCEVVLSIFRQFELYGLSQLRQYPDYGFIQQDMVPLSIRHRRFISSTRLASRVISSAARSAMFITGFIVPDANAQCLELTVPFIMYHLYL